MKRNIYVVGGLIFFGLLLAGIVVYNGYEMLRVVVYKTTYAATDLNAYDVMRHRAERQVRFNELLKTDAIFVVPARTECTAQGTNWGVVDEPMEVKFLTGPRSGKRGFIWTRDVQHVVAAP